MHYIVDFITASLVAYIGLTNFMADQVLAILPASNTENRTAEAVEIIEDKPLNDLPSRFSTKVIPDILLRSLAYQQANAIEAVSPNSYTEDLLTAIVNIYCTFTTPTTIRTTTGTGFFVHSSGVIMTNAHVAQYLLLESTDLLGDADCTIRQGNPAVAKFKAELLYIPPAWVQENAAVIDAPIPTGTGERDYALLYVSKTITDEPLPALFPALPLNTELLPLTIRGNEVSAAGFPATDLIENGASTPLLPRSAAATITELYTFGSNYADVFSITGSSVGAEGSSGGPVINAAGEAIGIIVTRGDDTNDGMGSLRAITLSHVNRTILEETGFPLEKNIIGNLPYRSKIFNEALSPFLIELLKNELDN